MTIKQAAVKYGVSPQAVYQRLKKRNILVESLIDKETQELTADGEVILDAMFNKAKQPIKANSRAFAEEKEKEIKQLRDERVELIEKLKLAEERVDFYRKQNEEINKALERAQELHQQTLNRLLPGKTEEKQLPERLTWKERFTGRVNRK